MCYLESQHSPGLRKGDAMPDELGSETHPVMLRSRKFQKHKSTDHESVTRKVYTVVVMGDLKGRIIFSKTKGNKLRFKNSVMLDFYVSN